MDMAGSSELFWDRYICGRSQSIILGWDWMALFVQVPMKCFEGRWDGKRCSKVGEHWENFSAEVLPSGGQKRDQFAVEVEIEILSRKKRHFGEIFPLFALHLVETLRIFYISTKKV